MKLDTCRDPVDGNRTRLRRTAWAFAPIASRPASRRSTRTDAARPGSVRSRGWRWGFLLVGLGLAAAPSGATAQIDSLTVTRLRYGGGGDWYANPSSLPNLLTAIRQRTGIVTARREETVAPLDPSLPDHPYLYMTGHGEVRFTPAEREALRRHLSSGGFLHADDNYGMDESFRREVALIFPDAELTEIPPDHPVFHVFYSLPEGLPKIHEHDGEPPRALGIFLGGRLAVFYSHESDLGDGWEDPDIHGDAPEVRESALRMGVNLFLYALGQEAS